MDRIKREVSDQFEKDYAFVYFADDGEQIKIGYSVQPEERIYQMRYMEKRPSLKFQGFVIGGRAVEQQLHARFEKDRVSGEWFSKSDDLIWHIGRNAMSLKEARGYVRKIWNEKKARLALEYGADWKIGFCRVRLFSNVWGTTIRPGTFDYDYIAKSA
jgi:hypothetical protein